MSQLRRLGSQVFWWQQCSQVLFVARSLILMRLLTPDVYGVFNFALMLGSYISVLRSFEFRQPIIATKELNPRLLSTQFGADVGICMINILICLAISPWIGGRYGQIVALVVLALLMADLTDAASGTPLYLAERDLEFPFIIRAKTIINLISIVITVILAWQGWGVWALVMDRAMVSGFMAVVIWSHTKWRYSWGWDRKSVVYLWSFCGLLFGVGMMGKIIFGFDIIVIGNYWNTTDQGYFSRAKIFSQYPMDLGSGFISMMALALYSSASRTSNESAAQSYRELTFNIGRISMWLAGVMAFLMADLVPFVFGHKWIPLTPIFIALLPYAIFRPLFQNAAQCITSLHEQKAFFFTILFLSPLYALGLLWLVHISMLWVALASGLVLLAGYVILEFRLQQRLGAHAWKTLMTPLLLLSAALAVFFRVQELGLSLPVRTGCDIALATVYTLAVLIEWRAKAKKLIVPTPVPMVQNR